MIKEKVLGLLKRLEEVEGFLGDPQIFEDKKKYRDLAREHAYLNEIKGIWSKVQNITSQLQDSKELLELEENLQYKQDIKDEMAVLSRALEDAQKELQTALVPSDPYDHYNTIVELRAGTGGDEAALFVGDCVRMYKLYCDRLAWKYEELSSSPSDLGGYREYCMVLSGKNVHRHMQYEAGTHRVQRVPETETQGRVHTSAITVAVLIEPSDDDEVKIDEKDLRIDTYRSSGAGGQHVNTTDSAVRITHLPTQIVVTCQSERSQIQNRERCMRLLKAKILEEEKLKKQMELASNRANQVGSGDRSERIRTYNFPQNRVTDHRISLTKYHLDQVMQGSLDDFTHALLTHFYQKKLLE